MVHLKKLLLLCAAFSFAATAQTAPLSITTGTTAPNPNLCRVLLDVGNVYVRSQNPNNGPVGVTRCTQTGSLTFAWQPIDHLVAPTLPTNCEVGALGYQTASSPGLYACATANTWTLVSAGGGSSFWQRNGATLSPATNGDIVVVDHEAILSAPAAPTIAVHGTPGSSTYKYAIVGITGAGGVMGASTTITNGAASLSATDFLRITIPPVTGATSCLIYRYNTGQGVVYGNGPLGTSTGSGFVMPLACNSTFDDVGDNLGWFFTKLDWASAPTASAGYAAPAFRSTGGGEGSEQFGFLANAYGTEAVAMGYGTSAGTNGIAIGSNVVAGLSGTAVGYNTSAAGQGVALGTSSNQVGNGGVAIGPSSLATDGGIAIGTNAHATDDMGIAIGRGVSATGGQGIIGSAVMTDMYFGWNGGSNKAKATTHANGYQEESTAAKPTCDVVARGLIYVEKGTGAGGADVPYACTQTSSTGPTYGWQQLSGSGGLKCNAADTDCVWQATTNYAQYDVVVLYGSMWIAIQASTNEVPNGNLASLAFWTPVGPNASYPTNVTIGNNVLVADPLTGDKNVAIGDTSMGANNVGSFNTGIGERSLRFNALGVSNTAVGSQALYQNDGGTSNTGVGVAAGASNGDGVRNTYLGASADTANTGHHDQTVIGSSASGDCNNCVVIGTASDTVSIPGTLAFPTAGNGIVLKSPNGGTCARITIANTTGALVSSVITCP